LHDIDPISEGIIDFAILGGDGYGESICVHLGQYKWGIIDTFIEREKNRPAALVYLELLGQDFESVQFIQITHHHNDHNGGLKVLIEECPNAKIFLPDIFDGETFHTLIRNPIINWNKKNRLYELAQAIKYVDSIEGRYCEYSKQDSPIHVSDFNDDVKIKVYAVSPNNYTKDYFLKKIGKRTEAYNVLLKGFKPNLTSVAVLITIGSLSYLMTADLEITDNNNTGLFSILESIELKDKCCIIFKIPHHGSENGFRDGSIWDSLICNNDSVLVCTPFNRLAESKKLPVKEMQKKITDKFPYSYITSNPRRTFKNIHSEVETKRLLRKFGKQTIPLINDFGIVRLRSEINSEDIKIDLYGKAQHLSDLMS